MTAEHHIEFSLVHGSEDAFPRPYPANREIPDWFRAMPAEVNISGSTTRTLKNCPPLLEAMTCGYIIPLVADILVGVDAAGRFQGTGKCQYGNILAEHSAPQQKGSPFENMPVLKILNPWLLRTPPGYSTLFLAPLNRFHMPLFPLAGLVETDIFYREVNFPSILIMRPGTRLTLPRGTPLVQVIPIKREEFQCDFVAPDLDKYNAMDLNTRDVPENYNFYKDNFWRKKGYR
jgi:hypothetical protein